VCLGTEDGDF